uniref:hypothetical protein n=1 Tax=Halomonas sp. TaxID=1486246 RepID=UPI002635449B|nr:hypothetical protein [Halomonas sp.]
MIAVDHDLATRLIDRARFAPSAHNTQPTRVALHQGKILIRADPARQLPVSDPHGHDIRLSHGAFIEGLSIALSEEHLHIDGIEILPNDNPTQSIASVSVGSGGEADPLAAFVTSRTTWRGPFRKLHQAEQLAQLAPLEGHPDISLITEHSTLTRIAQLTDEASLHFMRDAAQRRELLHWMRLTQRHDAYERDGLNADAMGLGRVEAMGARLVLGPFFALLDTVGLAAKLTAEAAITGNAAAIALYHRPTGEDPLITGRALYRAWLAMEQAGLAGRPLSVLTDWTQTAEAMARLAPLPSGRQLVKAFRIGVPDGDRRTKHERLPVNELLLAS